MVCMKLTYQEFTHQTPAGRAAYHWFLVPVGEVLEIDLTGCGNEDARWRKAFSIDSAARTYASRQPGLQVTTSVRVPYETVTVAFRREL